MRTSLIFEVQGGKKRENRGVHSRPRKKKVFSEGGERGCILKKTLSGRKKGGEGGSSLVRDDPVGWGVLRQRR